MPARVFRPAHESPATPGLGDIAGPVAHYGDEYIDAVVFWQRYSLQYVLGSKVFWEEVVLRNKAGRFYVSGGVQSSDYGVPDGSLFGDELFLASLVGRPGPGSQLPDSAAGYSNEYVDAVVTNYRCRASTSARLSQRLASGAIC